MPEQLSETELKALISLLDDNDESIFEHVSDKIKSLGTEIIPALEAEWEDSFNPPVQSRIEELIHQVQTSVLRERLTVWKEAEQQDIMEGLWLIATFQYPDIELETLNNKINLLFDEVDGLVHNEMHPKEKIEVLNNYFFKTKKFSANTKNFHSPSNSMINIVLESHKGNPITLCMIYMMVANKLNISLYGVNLPNLFVLIYETEGQEPFYINVFNRGLIFSKEDIESFVDQLKLKHYESFFERCSPLEIVIRNVRNLIVAFEKLSEREKVSELQQILDILSK